MKNWLSLILSLNVLALLVPMQAYASNHCEPNQVYDYKSIECCIGEDLSVETCTNAIDQLPYSFLDAIRSVKNGFLNNQFDNSGPNCFWAALAFHDLQILGDFRTVYEREFVPVMREKFIEIGQENLALGDIVVLSNDHPFDPDPGMNAELIYAEIPFHAGIYLGGGLLLQKENYRDEVFSLNTLENSSSAYADEAADQFRLDTEIKFYQNASD